MRSTMFFFFQAEDGIRDLTVTGVQTCALPISARLDPNAIALLNLFPAPNNPSLFSNFASNPVLRVNANQFDARGDQAIGAKDQMFVRVSYSDSGERSRDEFGRISEAGSFGKVCSCPGA